MNPVWPVLLVAALGVIGTLGAAASTQVLTTRREVQRWQKERADEQRRWDRERADRLELWRREDQLRQHEARKDIYVEFMQALWSWGRLAATVRTYIDSGIREFSTEIHKDLTGRGVKVVELLAVIELASSPRVRDPARKCSELIDSFTLGLRSDQIDVHGITSTHDSYKSTARRTLEAMREDWGLAPMLPDEYPALHGPATFG